MRNIWWILGVGALIWVGAHAEAAVMSPLTTAFDATGAKPSGYSVNDWVQVENPKNMLAMAEKTAHALHLRARLVTTNGSAYQKATATTTVAGITTRLIVEQLDTGAMFLVLDRASPQGFTGLRATQALFLRALKPYGSPHSDINLEGTIPGRLSSPQQQQVIHRGLTAIGAAVVNGITTQGYISDAGRSGFIAGSDQIEGHAVNIQIATTYNSYLHATQVYVGSPLITVTY